MKKVKTIFKKDPNDLGKVIDEPNDGMEWVFNGEGVAIKKLAGTCCLVKGGKLFRRYTLRAGKTPPSGYEQVDFDEKTNKGYGWIPVDILKPADKYHIEAWANISLVLPDGTCELIGPKLQGNPENIDFHMLVPHSGIGAVEYPDIPLGFNQMKEWMKGKDFEGVVFHHPDGRMGKIRKGDFGMERMAGVKS